VLYELCRERVESQIAVCILSDCSRWSDAVWLMVWWRHCLSRQVLARAWWLPRMVGDDICFFFVINFVISLLIRKNSWVNTRYWT